MKIIYKIAMSIAIILLCWGIWVLTVPSSLQTACYNDNWRGKETSMKFCGGFRYKKVQYMKDKCVNHLAAYRSPVQTRICGRVGL